MRRLLAPAAAEGLAAFTAAAAEGLAAFMTAALLLAPVALAAAPPKSPTPAAPLFPGPPFDVTTPMAHRLTMALDLAPARDLIALLTGAPDAPVILRRLKASRPVVLALQDAGIKPDDFFGRLVAWIAGTPDPLLSTYSSSAARLTALLDLLETQGPEIASIAARRIASILPGPAASVQMVLVPLAAAGGFEEVHVVADGESLYLIADLPRLIGDAASPPPSREVELALFRAASSAAWRRLFSERVRRPPAWPAPGELTIDALLADSVAEGPPALFLIPDEFFPISTLLEEPITRAFNRFNRACEILADTNRKETERREVFELATRGTPDFWRRYGAVVGAEMADVLIRRVGRDTYLEALAKGPRAVALLYAAERRKAKQDPLFSPALRKYLESPPPTPAVTPALTPTATLAPSS